MTKERAKLLEELAALREWAADTDKPSSLPAIARYMRRRHDNDHRELEILALLKEK